MAQNEFDARPDDPDDRLVSVMGKARVMLMRAEVLELEMRRRLTLALVTAMVALIAFGSVMSLMLSVSDRLQWPLTALGLVLFIVFVAAAIAALEARQSLPTLRVLNRMLETRLMKAEHLLRQPS